MLARRRTYLIRHFSSSPTRLRRKRGMARWMARIPESRIKRREGKMRWEDCGLCAVVFGREEDKCI